jgi:hypothetical protein
MPSSLLFAAGAYGQDNWQNSAGGSWGTPGNWSLNALPGAAVFNVGSASGYTVTLPASESPGSVTVQTDNTTIGLGGNTLSVFGLITVAPPSGQTGALTFSGGTVALQSNTSFPPIEIGSVSVAVGGTLTLNTTSMTLSEHGNVSVSGALNVTNSQISLPFDGGLSISTGTLSNGTINVGDTFSAGALSLSNKSSIGASFPTASWSITSATVDNSSLSNPTTTLSVGNLTVKNGGSVSGTGLTLGTAGIVSGSLVDIGGDPFTVQTSLSIQMTTGEATFSNVATTFSGATLNLTLPAGVTPTQGSTYQPFDILTAPGGSITPFSTINLPALSPGLSWDTSKLYANGTVTVVPEPAAIGVVIGAATLALGWRRRKPSIV